MVGRDLVGEVTCAAAVRLGARAAGRSRRLRAAASRAGQPRSVVAYDFGIKRNILRNLVASGCRVRVVPAATPAARGAGA